MRLKIYIFSEKTSLFGDMIGGADIVVAHESGKEKNIAKIKIYIYVYKKEVLLKNIV